MRYLGNKDSIVDIIKNAILSNVNIEESSVFFDAFCGTGSVANCFKDKCNVVINDSLSCASTYSYGRIVSSRCKFEKLGFNPFEFLNCNDTQNKGYFYYNYSLGGSSRMYFSIYNAGRIDFFRDTIQKWYNSSLINEDENAFLLACLIESVSSVSNTAGVYGAYLKKWDERALKKITFINISDNIKVKGKISVYAEKIEQIIDKIKCDILYLDPPYTQNQYGTQYHLLETLILNDHPKEISQITGSRSTKDLRSDWSKIYKVHILLDRVIAKTTANHIFISYNNSGDMSEEYIEAIMKRYGFEETFRRIEIPYKKYENWKSRNNSNHFEYLFYIKKKPINDVVFESPLNYIGSKAKIVPYIKEKLPSSKSFIDLFAGGFNVGINANSDVLVYNDINFIVKDLIESFRKYDTYDYITYVKKFINSHNLEKGNKESYNVTRDYYNNLPPDKKDSRMLFALILYSYQQQIRFNSNYEYNNPAGIRWFNDCILAKLVSFCRVIKEKDVIFLSEDYLHIHNQINIDKDTFLYLDPPYKLTVGSYNDGKRGFKGWNEVLEQELFNFIDEMSKKNVPCMLSYVLEHKGVTNLALKNWIEKNNYTYISLGEIKGVSGQPRKEILVLNYGI